MVEQAIFFGLGFAVAGLLALAVLPAFWRRAYRLTRQRLEALLPISPAEVAAERDQLRARFALERRHLELEIEKAAHAQFAAMQDAGKRLAIIAERDRAIAEQKITIGGLELVKGELTERLDDAQQQIRDLSEARDAMADELRETREALATESTALAAMREAAETRRRAILDMQSQADWTKARIAELEESLSQARQAARGKGDEVRALERTLREKDTDIAVLEKKLAAQTEMLERRMTAAGTQESERAALSSAIDEIRDRLRITEEAGQERERALIAAQRRVAELERERRDSQQVVVDLAQTIERMKRASPGQDAQGVDGASPAAAVVRLRPLQPPVPAAVPLQPANDREGNSVVAAERTVAAALKDVRDGAKLPRAAEFTVEPAPRA